MKSKKNDLVPHVHPSHVEAEPGKPVTHTRADRIAGVFPVSTNDEGSTSLPASESVDLKSGCVRWAHSDPTRTEKAAARRPLRNRD